MKKLFLILFMLLPTSLFANKIIIGSDLIFSAYQKERQENSSKIVYYTYNVRMEDTAIIGMSTQEVFDYFLNNYNYETDYLQLSTKHMSYRHYFLIKVDSDTFVLKNGTQYDNPTKDFFIAFAIIAGIAALIVFFVEIIEEPFEVNGLCFTYGLLGLTFLFVSKATGTSYFMIGFLVGFELLLLKVVENWLFECRLYELPDEISYKYKQWRKRIQKKKEESKSDPYEVMLRAKSAYEKALKAYEKSKEKVVWKEIKIDG